MIRVSALTDIGKVRQENQDSILICEAPDDSTRRRRGTLLVVADGMGGLEDGKVASQIAVDALEESYFSASGEVREALVEAVRVANRRIYDHALSKGNGQLMGSTCTAVAMMEHGSCIAQVGDSRAYHYHEGRIRQVTRDHSLVRELVDRGELDPQAIQYSFHRNVLTRGLGLQENVEVDVFELSDIPDGDMLLLTSDGLHELVEEDELVGGIETHGDQLDAFCRHCIDIANSRGGKDNISLVVALLGRGDDAAEAREEEAETDAVVAPQRLGCLVPLTIGVCLGALLKRVFVGG